MFTHNLHRAVGKAAAETKVVEHIRVAMDTAYVFDVKIVSRKRVGDQNGLDSVNLGYATIPTNYSRLG